MKNVDVKATVPNPRGVKVYALRNSNPEKYTWATLDAKVYGAKNSHGGRSFAAYKAEAARLKTVGKKRSHKKKIAVLITEPTSNLVGPGGSVD